MSHPTTTAGVTLERIVRNAMPAADGVRDFILAIEAEARAAVLREVREVRLEPEARRLAGGSHVHGAIPARFWQEAFEDAIDRRLEADDAD